MPHLLLIRTGFNHSTGTTWVHAFRFRQRMRQMWQTALGRNKRSVLFSRNTAAKFTSQGIQLARQFAVKPKCWTPGEQQLLLQRFSDWRGEPRAVRHPQIRCHRHRQKQMDSSRYLAGRTDYGFLTTFTIDGKTILEEYQTLIRQLEQRQRAITGASNSDKASARNPSKTTNTTTRSCSSFVFYDRRCKTPTIRDVFSADGIARIGVGRPAG